MLKIKNLTKVYGDKKAGTICPYISGREKSMDLSGIMVRGKRQPLNPVVEYYSLRKGKS